MKIRVFLAVAVTAAICLAGTRDPKKADSEHVQYGSQFKCVAKISCKRESDGAEQFASCVIISPTHIVTAAHVVDGTDGWVVTCDDKTSRKLTGIAIHPEYDEGKLGSFDLAVGRMGEPLDLDFYPPLYDKDDEIGKVVSISGYGMCGTFASGATSQDCRKRGGSNIVSGAARGCLFCSVTDSPGTSLEFLISPGDSGGGMFSANGELMGVNSFLMGSKKGKKPTSSYGEESAHTRISSVRDWILQESKCDD